MSKQIKILVIPSWYPPDGGYFFKEHSEALARAGCEVSVLVNRVIGIRRIGLVRKGSCHRFQVGNENNLRVVRSIYWKIPGNERLNIKLWARSTCKLYQKFAGIYGKPDLILAHSAVWAGLAAEYIFGEDHIPYIITEHRSFFVWERKGARESVKPFYIPYLKTAFHSCRKLIMVSESMKSGMQELFPELETRIQVIPNMINGAHFSFPEKPRQKDPFIFFSAGRLAEVKGVDTIISAFEKMLKKTGHPAFLRIAGRGELREQLERQVQQAGLSERITFLGRIDRDQMAKEMQAANCFLLGSSYEAFGAVLIEAMSTGLPVIATRSGGPERIMDESCGYLVNVGDTEELSEAMIQMARNYESFDQEKIRKRTLELYGSERITQLYINLFLEVLH